MLSQLHSVVVDPAFCLHEKVIIYSNDRSTDGIDIGTVDITNLSIVESVHQLNSFHGSITSSSTERRGSGNQTDGLLRCNSKLITYTANGYFSCYDKVGARSISSVGTINMGLKSKVSSDVRCACASRNNDELCFFSLAGEMAVFVMYFTSQGRDQIAKMTQPINIGEKGLHSKGGIILLECHPTLPYLFIMSAEGVSIWSYTNLLQRVDDVNDNNPEEGNSSKGDDMSDNGSQSGSTQMKNKKSVLRRGLFKSKSKMNLPDMILIGNLLPPNSVPGMYIRNIYAYIYVCIFKCICVYIYSYIYCTRYVVYASLCILRNKLKIYVYIRLLIV
jgi:hypothetical protein